MGAWDVGSFDNDNASDWVWGLDDAEDTGILQEAFSSILESDDDYPESPDCCEALAAAEVVAALRGRPLAELPPEVTSFVDRMAAKPSPELVRMAVEAIKRIKAKSELRELWDDSESAEQWLDELANLRKRLA